MTSLDTTSHIDLRVWVDLDAHHRRRVTIAWLAASLAVVIALIPLLLPMFRYGRQPVGQDWLIAGLLAIPAGLVIAVAVRRQIAAQRQGRSPLLDCYSDVAKVWPIDTGRPIAVEWSQLHASLQDHHWVCLSWPNGKMRVLSSHLNCDLDELLSTVSAHGGKITL